jgi:serine/threonine protein phosphatase PrpC
MLYGTSQVNGRGRSPPSSEDRISIENLMDGCDFVAVYDGHSGDKVANLSKSMLYKKIQEAILALGPDALTRKDEIASLLKRVFIEHNKYLASVIDTLDDSGSTATVALVTSTHIFLAYIGDSPCFMMHPQTGRIIEEMGKHEPSLAVETARIQAAGGFVEIDEYGTPRVDGMLAVARAFGDFSLNWKGKVPPAGADWAKMKVTAHPDVMVWKRPDVGLLAIMSDGLVESDSSTLKPLAQVAHDIQKGLEASSYNLKGAAEKVVANHVRQGGGRRYSGDDLSLILINVGTGTNMEGGAQPLPVKLQKPPTRKMKGRRRIRTEKQSRLIKIFSC